MLFRQGIKARIFHMEYTIYPIHAFETRIEGRTRIEVDKNKNAFFIASIWIPNEVKPPVYTGGKDIAQNWVCNKNRRWDIQAF